MDWRACLDACRATRIDVVMLAGDYTLLRRDSTPLLDHCLEYGIRVIAASPFNSGILVHGPIAGSLYNFGAPSNDVVQLTKRMQQACVNFGVPLAAAALQFPSRHPAVSTVVVGTRTVAELEQNLALLDQPIPIELWAELDPSTPLPHHNRSGCGLLPRRLLAPPPCPSTSVAGQRTGPCRPPILQRHRHDQCQNLTSGAGRLAGTERESC